MNFQNFNQFAKPLTAPTVTLPETAAAVLPSITLPVIDTTVHGAPVITAPVIDTNR